MIATSPKQSRGFTLRQAQDGALRQAPVRQAPLRQAQGKQGKGLALRQAQDGAFTLIELLTVIVIILILVGVGASVGAGILGASNIAATRATMQQLDMIHEEYKLIMGTYVNYDTEGEFSPPSNSKIAATPAMPVPAVPWNQIWYHWVSIEFFVFHTSLTPELGSMYKTFSSNVMTDADSYVAGSENFNQVSRWALSGSRAVPDGNAEIRDAWGQPIFYKSFHRSIDANPTAVADGTWGMDTDFLPNMPNNTPYFASAGPDTMIGHVLGDPTSIAYKAIDDNLFSNALLDPKN